jgi:hypothetical protein
MKHSAPSLPRRRAVRLGLVLTPVLAVALGTSVIWQTSYAAFSATTENGVNKWNAGGLSLVDNDLNSVMFNVSGMKPGATDTKCIQVTGNGSLPGTVRLYGAGTTTTNALSSHITLTITKGTGGTNSDCSDFTGADATPLFSDKLATLGTTRNSWANGLTTWSTAGGNVASSRSFKFTYTFDSGAPNSTQNGTAETTFTWESQAN